MTKSELCYIAAKANATRIKAKNAVINNDATLYNWHMATAIVLRDIFLRYALNSPLIWQVKLVHIKSIDKAVKLIKFK